MTDLSIADKEFLEKVEQTVKENIPNENFGVSELAAIVGMSRSNLHRKVNVLTNISVSQYIRYARLQHGKELLQTTSHTVSEVAYKAGFNSPSYFIKCFHDYFGYPPGEVSELVVNDSGVVKEVDKSIAVLPFKSLSTDPDKQYLADGVMDSILLHLSKIENLRVISRTSVEQYRDTEKTINNICQELEVSYLLEGSFQKYGDEARLIAQLIQPGKENHVWANDYDRNWKDIFSVQSEVAQTVAGELHAVITPKEKQLIERIPTTDLTAYEVYLKGNFHLKIGAPKNLDIALLYFEQARDMDPKFALAYVGISHIWLYRQQMGYVLPEIAGPEIYSSLIKALELDPENADSLFLTAAIAYLAEWDWEKGEKEFLKAIALRPNDAKSRIFYSHLLYILHRPGEAAIQARLALDLDPLNPVNLVPYSYSLVCAQDFDTALVYAEKALEIDPDNYLAINQIGEVAFRCKKYDRVFEAQKSNLQAYSSSDGQFDEDRYNEIERIYKKQGFFAAYEEILNQYEELYKKELINPGVMAIFYITGNQQEKALDCLEKGFEIRDPQMPYIASGGYPFDSLYNHPRFIAILEKMKLPLPPSE